MRAQNYYLAIGTYTDNSISKGIYVYQLDGKTGQSKFVDSVISENPSYISFDSKADYLYAVNENETGKGMVSAFSFDRLNGELHLLNIQKTKGDAPCFIKVDKSGLNVLLANYGDGSFNLFKTNPDGSLKSIAQSFQHVGKGPKKEQDQAHAHGTFLSPDEKYLFETDLGLDKIFKYNYNPHDAQPLTVGKPEYYTVPSGFGPRHIVFSNNGKFLYLLGELAGQIITFSYKNGVLQPLQTISSTGEDTSDLDKGSAAIRISPNGKFLYASNRGETNSIGIFAIGKDGKLTFVANQKVKLHPRDFIFTPNGKWLIVASRDNNAVELYKVDINRGTLINSQQDIKLGKPVGLAITAF